ncbi:MAG: type II secretion system protein GspM [Pseudomonadota bacterium]
MTRTLTSREKLLATLSGTLVLCASLWTLVVQPAYETRIRSLDQLSKLDAVEQILVSQPPRQVQRKPAAEGRLSQRITEMARTAALEIQRLDPQGSAVGVSLEAVPFPALISWIDALNATAGVRVRAAEIARSTEPGTVSARLLFEDAR